MTNQAKVAKISKEHYNYLKENRKMIGQVIKSMDKREKNELSVGIEDSSELSQSAIVQVDLTGMKPTISEGGNAERDMPVRKRKATVIAAEEEGDVEEEDVQEEMFEAEEEEEEEAVEEEAVQEEPTSQESVQSDQPVVLPERLLNIVKSNYLLEK